MEELRDQVGVTRVGSERINLAGHGNIICLL